MAAVGYEASLEEQIGRWRSYLRRRQAINSPDAAELEDHLRSEIGVLINAGLAADEAFFVATKRMGELDALSREFAREHSERLWKQLVTSSPAVDGEKSAARSDAILAFALALAAALLVKVPAFLGYDLDVGAAFYARNASLFVFPLLSAYFAWKRSLDARTFGALALAFAVAAAVANLPPFGAGGDLDELTALHLPIGLWLVVGIAYAGGRWNEVGGRMDFIRFSGELFLYYVLIALGGGVLTAFTALIFGAIGIEVDTFIGYWLLPCGAVSAVMVAAWLVEAKQSVIENLAPVLTRLFAPLFAALIVAFLAALVVTGQGIDVERNVLIGFDLLLVVVLGLLLYSLSARDPLAPPGAADFVQVALVVSALLADAVALWAIGARIGEFGFTPNRVAALGENLILLVNLAWSAFLYVRFLRGEGTFGALERWQTEYLPVYAAWAAIVVIVFPLIF